MKGKLIKTDKGYILEGDNLPNPRRLSIKNCQAIELGYDLDELISNHLENNHIEAQTRRVDVIKLLILELLGDKKFTEKDIVEAYLIGCDKRTTHPYHIKENLMSLQQTEWEVEVIMDRIPADLAPGGWDVFPKLDANNCLILKRVE